MPYCVQYDTSTGLISGTVDTRDKPAPFPMPDNRGQLVFDSWQETDGKVVDLNNLKLVDSG